MVHTLHSFIARFAFVLAVVWFIPVASAQLEVRMEPTKGTFVAHSPVYVKVTIMNRSSKTVTLKGPSKTSSWLNFRVLDNQQNMITSRRDAPMAAPLTVEASKQVSLKVNLNKAYPMNRFGNYRVVANVYNPNSKRFSSSSSKLITVDEAKSIWKQIVGLGGGRKAEYSLLSYRGFDKTHLYYRLRDAESGFIRKTYQLGDLIQYRAPQAAVDRSNRMHVLYQAAPRQYIHDQIKSDGKFLKRKVYEDYKGSRPELVQSKDGNVRVTGGINPEVKSSEKREKLKDLARIRRLSDRPLGY